MVYEQGARAKMRLFGASVGIKLVLGEKLSMVVMGNGYPLPITTDCNISISITIIDFDEQPESSW